jgi:transposase
MVHRGMTQKQVCADLGVSKSALSKWVHHADLANRGLPVPKEGSTEDREMRQALRRIKELEMENEILRRAAAYLSRANLVPPK